MKYFEEDEFSCDGEPCFDKMDKEFLEKLDEVRSYSESPFHITSSWRSKEHNKRIGGTPNSAHLRGLAVDISAPNGKYKYDIITAAIKANIKRIGVGSNFVHIDIDPSLPQEIILTY